MSDYTTHYESASSSVELIPSQPSYSLATTSTPSTADLMARWIAYVDSTPKTIATYTRAVRQFSQYLAERGIAQPTRETILEYKRDLLSKGLKPSTINSYLESLRLFYSWAEIEGLYINIAKNIKGEKQNREHKKDYLTADQCKDLLGRIDRSTAQGKRDYAMACVMIVCGLRTIEVSRANVEDIATAGGNSVIYVQGKGRAERAEYVKLPSLVERAIREYLATRGQAEGSAPLFTSTSHNNAGQRMTTRSISGIIKALMVGAGFNDNRHTAHSLRHTAVSLALIANGGNIQEAQQFARHRNIATTIIYAHNLDRGKNTCAESIAQALI